MEAKNVTKKDQQVSKLVVSSSEKKMPFFIAEINNSFGGRIYFRRATSKEQKNAQSNSMFIVYTASVRLSLNKNLRDKSYYAFLDRGWDRNNIIENELFNQIRNCFDRPKQPTKRQSIEMLENILIDASLFRRREKFNRRRNELPILIPVEGTNFGNQIHTTKTEVYGKQ